MDYHCTVDCGQLSINWQVMGTSNETDYSAIPVTKRNVHFDGNLAGTIKVIVRVSAVALPLDWRHSVFLKKVCARSYISMLSLISFMVL